MPVSVIQLSVLQEQMSTMQVSVVRVDVSCSKCHATEGVSCN
jgi:hypothetical protein